MTTVGTLYWGCSDCCSVAMILKRSAEHRWKAAENQLTRNCDDNRMIMKMMMTIMTMN